MSTEDDEAVRPQITDNATDFYYDESGLSSAQRMKYRRLRRQNTGEWNGGEENKPMAQRKANRERFQLIASKCELPQRDHVRADTLFAKADKQTTLIQGYSADLVALACSIRAANESFTGKGKLWVPTWTNGADNYLGDVADMFNLNRKHLGRVYYRLFIKGEDTIV